MANYKDLSSARRMTAVLPLLVLATIFLSVLQSSAADVKGWQLINIDMDGSIPAQKEVASRINGHANLRESENSLRLYASKKGRASLRSAVYDLRAQYPNRWLTFTGSGDFHQTSAILLETLPKLSKPVTLIMLDNHPDWSEMPLRYHCGTWVATALHLPWIEHVILIGQNSKDLSARELIYAPFRDLCSGRVTLYPLKRDRSVIPFHWSRSVLGAKSSKKLAWGTALSFETVRDIGLSRLATRLATQLKDKNVYMSIDKDVLGKNWAVTDWDQSEFSIDDLLTLISTVSESVNVVGVDVCGEQSPDALRGPWKRLDAARVTDKRSPDWKTTNEVNQRTNLRIIDAIQHVSQASQ